MDTIRPPPPPLRDYWPSDLPLVQLTPKDVVTLRRALGSILVIGQKDSGKSSGSVATFRRAFLKEGCGFLVLCCKADAAQDFIELAEECGRGADVIRFRIDNGSSFNPIDYSARIHGSRNGMVEGLVDLFYSLQKNVSGDLSRSGDDIWDIANRQLLKKMFFTQIQAMDRIDLGDSLRIIQSLAHSFGSLEEPEQLHSLRMLMEAENNAPQHRGREMELAGEYFRGHMAGMNSRTRSSIQFTASGCIDACLSWPSYELHFGGESNVTPDDVLNGRIVVVDVPTEVYAAPVGKISAYIWKTAVQAAIKRRVATFTGDRNSMRPCVIDMDEAQEFLTGDDAGFLATSRGAKGLILMATQSLPSIYGTVGADGKAKAKVEEILANATVRIAHRSLCQETNKWYVGSLGEVIKRTRSGGTSSGTSESSGSSESTGTSSTEGTSSTSGTSMNYSIGVSSGSSHGQGGGSSQSGSSESFSRGRSTSEGKSSSRGTSTNRGTNSSQGTNRGVTDGWTESLQSDIPPRLLVEQKNGGPENKGEVTGVVILGGDLFSNGQRWMQCSFWQKGWGPKGRKQEGEEEEGEEEMPVLIWLFVIVAVIGISVVAGILMMISDFFNSGLAPWVIGAVVLGYVIRFVIQTRKGKGNGKTIERYKQ